MTDPRVNNEGQSCDTSHSLLVRVQNAEPAAWQRLVQLYGPLVYSWCLRSGLQPADAADVGQEVFAAVARSIGSFRHTQPGDTFRGWLFVITRNKLRDHATPPGGAGPGGTDAQHRLNSIAAPTDDSDTEPALDEDRILFRRAVELIRSEFEPRTWEAFWRATVDEEHPGDVAAALGISPNAVYLAKSRVLRRLREEFDAMIQFDGTDQP